VHAVLINLSGLKSADPQLLRPPLPQRVTLRSEPSTVNSYPILLFRCCRHTYTPRAEKNNWGCNLQGKVVSAPPGRARSQILRRFFCWAGDIWRVGVANVAVLGCFLATTKKVLNFFDEKSAPTDPGYAYGRRRSRWPQRADLT